MSPTENETTRFSVTNEKVKKVEKTWGYRCCLLYTSDAADE